MTHTSGIPSYTDDPAFLGSVTEPTTEDDLIATFAGKDFRIRARNRFSL